MFELFLAVEYIWLIVKSVDFFRYSDFEGNYNAWQGLLQILAVGS